MFLLSTGLLTAQVNNLPTIYNLADGMYLGNAFGVVPSSLSFDGTKRIYIRTADDQVAIYNNDFTPVKQFSIAPTLSGDLKVTSERTVTVTVQENLVKHGEYQEYLQQIYYYSKEQEDWLTTYDIPESWNNDSIKKFLEHNYSLTIASVEPQEDGVVLFIPDRDLYTPDNQYSEYFFHPEKYGKKYLESIFCTKNGFLYQRYIPYYEEKQNPLFEYSDWKVVKREEPTKALSYGLDFVNFDTDQRMDGKGGNGLGLTQTLFNEDENYEYISFTISSYSEEGYSHVPDEPECVSCYQHDTTLTRQNVMYHYPIYTGFEIKSESGNTLQSVSFPSGYKMNESVEAVTIKLSNEYYLLCVAESNDNTAMLIYKINRKTQSVNLVGEPVRIAAYPNPANPNQTVTIRLNGGIINNGQIVLELTNMQGQVSDRRLVPAGQTEVTIPASYFTPGMNVIQALQNGQSVGTTKFIVK